MLDENTERIPMLHRIKHGIKSLLKNLPPVAQILKNIDQQKRYRTELALIKGIHENSSKHPSIIHFSFNKAATQYVKSMLRRCAVKNDMVPVGIHDYAFNTDFPFLDHLSSEEMEKYKHIFKRTGYLYSVFGGMIEGIPNLEEYKVVLVTRDPRDILVSEYYSIAYSHPVPSKMGDKHDKFMSKRVNARESTIDEYVILESDRVYDIFSRYQTLLIDKYKNTYLTTYEQMISDFEVWLTDLINYCELNVSREFIQSLLKENEDKKPKEENIHKHVRKGLPGDYKQKLQPETIVYLNEKFETVLKNYHY